MSDPYDSLPTELEIPALIEDFDAVLRQCLHLASATSIFAERASFHDSPNAARLYVQACNEALNSVRLLASAKTRLTWAQTQQAGEFDCMTVLADPDEAPRPSIRPFFDKQDARPVFEIEGAPLAGSDGHAWQLFIDEEWKHQGVLTVQAVAWFGQPELRHHIEIMEAEAVEDDDERLRWNPAQWVEFVRPIAEAKIAAANQAE